MLINSELLEMSNVKFISYDGRYPHLCSGKLTLKIDGIVVTFGSLWKIQTDYPKFWSSGGVCNSESCSTNEWEIDVRELPEIYRKYAAEIDRIFNDNVPHGCCGGCL